MFGLYTPTSIGSVPALTSPSRRQCRRCRRRRLSRRPLPQDWLRRPGALQRQGGRDGRFARCGGRRLGVQRLRLLGHAGQRAGVARHEGKELLRRHLHHGGAVRVRRRGAQQPHPQGRGSGTRASGRRQDLAGPVGRVRLHDPDYLAGGRRRPRPEPGPLQQRRGRELRGGRALHDVRQIHGPQHALRPEDAARSGRRVQEMHLVLDPSVRPSDLGDLGEARRHLARVPHDLALEELRPGLRASPSRRLLGRRGRRKGRGGALPAEAGPAGALRGAFVGGGSRRSPPPAAAAFLLRRCLRSS
mmetsp:Transcript_23906/g.75769  ORF Transcript_23906/g.75769 Transcript_23906/m.75769 type:complete len:302 (+) Transcript_23906:77-982(+)